MDAASIRTSTSSGPGVGTGTSSSVSPGADSRLRMARIVSTAGPSCHGRTGRRAAIRSRPCRSRPSPSQDDLEEQYDNPLERLQLLGGDDEAIAAFLDEIDVRGPRDREMLARARAHVAARAAGALRGRPPPRPRRAREPSSPRSPRRERGREARSAPHADPLPRRARRAIRRRRALQERRDEPAQPLLDARDAGRVGSRELELLRPARVRRAGARRDHERPRDRRPDVRHRRPAHPGRALGLAARDAEPIREWWIALLVGRDRRRRRPRSSRGSSSAAPRSRAGASGSRSPQPLAELWRTHRPAAARPPRDQSRRFAIIAISLTLGVWIVLPLLVTLSLAR